MVVCSLGASIEAWGPHAARKCIDTDQDYKISRGKNHLKQDVSGGLRLMLFPCMSSLLGLSPSEASCLSSGNEDVCRNNTTVVGRVIGRVGD